MGEEKKKESKNRIKLAINLRFLFNTHLHRFNFLRVFSIPLPSPPLTPSVTRAY